MKITEGSLVIHWRDGLSKIKSVFTKNEKEYISLVVLRDQDCEIFIPVSSCESYIRDIMSVEQGDELLRYIKTIEQEFNTNTKHRRDVYKRRLASSDIKDIAYMYRQYYFYKKLEDPDSIIKLRPIDIDMLSYAETRILDELALTYNVDRNEAEEFVNKRIENL